jgi:hypothetical protein
MKFLLILFSVLIGVICEGKKARKSKKKSSRKTKKWKEGQKI